MSATPEDRVFARRADDRLAAARDQFSPDPGFLDTASAGLPTAGTLAALARALEVWRPGRATPQSYDAAVAAARDRFARLVGVPVDRVAVGSQSSPFAGLVAASLPDGAEVVLPDCDFTSVVFPFLAQQVRGVRVRLVPLEALPEAVSEHTTLVVCSLVQSCDGRLVDLAAIRAVAAASGARVLLDVTQSAGWLPVDISDIDYVVCSAYKWLLCPRGVAFFVIRPERVAELTPVFANWYAGEDPWTSIYGGPLRLATTARRFDLSPAWLAWVGAVPALELLDTVGVAAIHDHDVALANRFRAGLGQPPGPSAIVSVCGIPDANARLSAAGVRASVRAGGLRASFHLYTTEADVDLALEVLADSRPA